MPAARSPEERAQDSIASGVSTFMRVWTRKEVDRLLSLRRGGLSLAEIAVILGRSSDSVAKCWCRHKPPCSDRRNSLTLAIRQRLSQLVDAGMCPSEISRELRVPGSTARKWLIRLGLLPHGRLGPHHTVSPSARERIGAAYGERQRRESTSLGWPEIVRPAHARLLRLLEGAGPLTLSQILDGQGKQSRGSSIRKTLRELRLLGYTEMGKAGKKNTYRVARWLLARREEECA